MESSVVVPIVARSALRYRPINPSRRDNIPVSVLAPAVTPRVRASKRLQREPVSQPSRSQRSAQRDPESRPQREPAARPTRRLPQQPVTQRETGSHPEQHVTQRSQPGTTSQPRHSGRTTRRIAAYPVRRHALPSLHWSLLCGLTMLGMVVLFWLCQNVWSWGQLTYNDLRYGRPRTVQMDAFVGHEKGDVASHFIALNNHGQIEVIEIPGGSTGEPRIFYAQHFSGPQADLIPVSIQFSDPQHTHHPDMIVSAYQSQVRFINKNGTFVPANQP